MNKNYLKATELADEQLDQVIGGINNRYDNMFEGVPVDRIQRREVIIPDTVIPGKGDTVEEVDKVR